MKLLDALEILRRPLAEDARTVRVSLACGFTPLHLETFLKAQLLSSRPSHSVEVETGLFGDLAGNLERSLTMGVDAVATVVEWADIDLRLGIRSLGGWGSADVDDILESANTRLSQLEELLLPLSERQPVVCCLPTLPLPPLFLPRPQESGPHELELRRLVAGSAALLAQYGIRVVNAQSLDEVSPLAGRADVRSDLLTGFPYTVAHASAVAEALGTLVEDPATKKGLVTDLDDTLWAGILGEVGVDNIGWNLDVRAQEHGLYQQVLNSLASAGVLIAVASKNDPVLVEQAFERRDILLRSDAVYPFEVSWGRKSDALARILKVWNVAPESVVFVDDSPIEVAEVQEAFPAVECLLFPRGDPDALWHFLRRLRQLFGKRLTSAEDLVRLKSIRSAAPLREAVERSGDLSDEFLQSANGSIIFTSTRSRDRRAFELINKTNQFNLNGRRLPESAWAQALEDTSAFLVTATYEDKYGPLGKIAALLGRRHGRTLLIDSWVMSCRAFSRRIEHQFLDYIFRAFDADQIVFDYETTERNGPLREFLASITGTMPEACRLTRATFLERAPALVHQVSEVNDA